MNGPLPTALARRLAAYSATTGIVFALAPSADAQVVYHDYDPDLVASGFDPLVSLDFDQDGTADLSNRWSSSTPFSYIRLLAPQGADPRNAVLGYEPFPFFPLVSRLTSGDMIGPEVAPPQNFFERAIAAAANGTSNGYYVGTGGFLNTEGYAGFRFAAGDGQLHYGWLRLRTEPGPTIGIAGVVSEYAYEAAPDTPIAAGQRSSALLDGSVSQTDFPASGGTLAYTFTVTNTTGHPLPLDLWLDANGPAARTHRLGSGTLGPGATASGTVRVRVPAGAPAGDYEVDFKLGEYATQAFITFERYAITKAAGTEALAAEPFAIEAVEGTLFAGADAVAITGTPVLSAPEPNPTDGRAALTLSLTEPQHVRVTVYDALGREVAVLHDGVLDADEAHRLMFDGSGLPSGVYVVRAVGERSSGTRVFTLTR